MKFSFKNSDLKIHFSLSAKCSSFRAMNGRLPLMHSFFFHLKFSRIHFTLKKNRKKENASKRMNLYYRAALLRTLLIYGTISAPGFALGFLERTSTGPAELLFPFLFLLSFLPPTIISLLPSSHDYLLSIF